MSDKDYTLTVIRLGTEKCPPTLEDIAEIERQYASMGSKGFFIVSPCSIRVEQILVPANMICLYRIGTEKKPATTEEIALFTRKLDNAMKNKVPLVWGYDLVIQQMLK